MRYRRKPRRAMRRRVYRRGSAGRIRIGYRM
jgi:hypothetical protein